MAKRYPIRKNIITFLEKHSGEWFTAYRIAEELDCNKTKVRNLCKGMAKATLIKERIGKNKTEYQYDKDVSSLPFELYDLRDALNLIWKKYPEVYAKLINGEFTEKEIKLASEFSRKGKIIKTKSLSISRNIEEVDKELYKNTKNNWKPKIKD